MTKSEVQVMRRLEREAVNNTLAALASMAAELVDDRDQWRTAARARSAQAVEIITELQARLDAVAATICSDIYCGPCSAVRRVLAEHAKEQ